MIYRLIILTVLLSLPTSVFADHGIDLHSTNWFSDFSKDDYEFQVVSTVVTFADLNQTLQFVDYGIPEQNSFLGDYPSRDRIIYSGLGAIAGQWFVSWALPAEASIFGFEFNPRRVFQVGVIAGEGWAVHHNYSIGVKIDL